jgi:hypothetical protein
MIMKILTSAVALLLSIALSMHGSAQAIPSVSLAPAAGPIGIGDEFTVRVAVTDVVDLYAYQIDFGFDPALLRFLGVTEGTFLSDLGPTNFIDGTVDNNAGSVSYVADSMTGAVSGRSGSGYLLDFRLLATGSGLTTLRLPDFLFLNSAFDELALAASPIDILIGPAAVPLPGTLLLLAAGLLAAGATNGGRAARRWQRERRATSS